MTLRGSVQDFSLEAILRFIASAGKSGRLDLGEGGAAGAVNLEYGALRRAETGQETGDAALGELLALAEGDFEFDPTAAAGSANLDGDIDAILGRARVERDRLVSIREVIPDDRCLFRLSERAASHASIELSSDQWRTLLAVNGVRDVHEIAQALHVARRAALGLLADLVRAGAIDAVAPTAVRPTLSPSPAAQPDAAIPLPGPEPEAPLALAAESWTDSWNQPPPPPAPLAAESWAEPAVRAAPTPAPSEDEWVSAPPTPLTTDQDDWNAPAASDTESWSVSGSAAQSEDDASPATDERLTALFGATPRADVLAAQPIEFPLLPEDEPGAWAAPAVEPAIGADLPPTPDGLMADALIAEPQPPAPAEPKPERRGLFGLGGKSAEPTLPTPPSAAATGVGKLAAFVNGLLNEYNSGRYGKSRIDERMTNLLLRVDELAEPLDRPVPLDGDRLAVRALDAGLLPATQMVPYLGMLINQIFVDAEHAFGRDKAKQGYRSTRQAVLGDDAVLDAPQLAGRLPKV